MKLKEKVSWLMGTVQRTLFPHLDECLTAPLTAQEKRLVKILELVHVENNVPKSASRQGLGRPLKERAAIARPFVAKAVLGYPPTRSLLHALRTPATLRPRCGERGAWLLTGRHRVATSTATSPRGGAAW